MPSLPMGQLSSNRRVRTSDWREVYFTAVLEGDPYYALTKIESARSVMQQRLLALQSKSEVAGDELGDLHCALTYLQILFLYLRDSVSDARLLQHPGSERNSAESRGGNSA